MIERFIHRPTGRVGTIVDHGFVPGTVLFCVHGPAPRRTTIVRRADLAEAIKVCNCCGAGYDLEAWRALQLIGVQHDGAEGADNHELRDCACHNTLGVPVRVAQAEGARASAAGGDR